MTFKNLFYNPTAESPRLLGSLEKYIIQTGKLIATWQRIFQKLQSRAKQKSRYITAQMADFSVCTCYVTAFAREHPHVKYVIFGCIRISLAGNTHNGDVCLTYVLGVLVYHIVSGLSRRILSSNCNITEQLKNL